MFIPCVVKVPSSSRTSSSLCAAASPSFSWRRRWVSLPVKEASPAGGKSAHCLRVSHHFTSCELMIADRPTAVSSCLGIGYATQVIEAHLNVYYIVILAWAIFYLFNCFTTELPWAGCGHYWNTGKLVESAFCSCFQSETRISWSACNVTMLLLRAGRELRRLLRGKRHQHHQPQRDIAGD